MEDQIKELITSKRKLFLKNKKYIIDNDWSKKGEEDHKKLIKYNNFQYFPKIVFKGYTEYYTMQLPIEEIISNKLQCQNL